jgi:glycosyltransferase involved in cell wall biosynthesis
MHHPILHVMHVLTDTNIGGAGTLLCNQLATFDRTQFCFTIVLPRGSHLAKRLAALPLPCHLLYTDHGADRSADWKSIGEYIRIFRAHRPDIVHTHAALSARVAARVCRVPVCIHTRHCVFPLTARQTSSLYRAAFRTANHLLSDGVIAVADAAKSQLIALGMREDDIRVIINGVQPLRTCSEEETAALRRRLDIPKTAFVIGMVARLEPYKGHATLLDALATLLKAEPHAPIYAILCGDGSQRAALEAQATELGISDHVRFAGFCADVAPYYAIMNVNVNASSEIGIKVVKLKKSVAFKSGYLCSEKLGGVCKIYGEAGGIYSVLRTKDKLSLFHSVKARFYKSGGKNTALGLLVNGKAIPS